MERNLGLSPWPVMKRKRTTYRMRDMVDEMSREKETSGQGPHKRGQRMRDVVAETKVVHEPSFLEKFHSKKSQPDLHTHMAPLHTSTTDTSQTYTAIRPSHDSDTNGDDAISIRRGRGASTAWKGWGEVRKIIEWNEDCLPIGKNASKLNSHIGYCGRNLEWFPLYWTSWHAMDKTTLENVWKDIQANTNAPDGFKEICFRKMGTAWRKFKHNVKRNYYESYAIDEERLTHKPSFLDPAQWAELVRYWSSEPSKNMASRNSMNREKLCAHPRTGRTSFASLKEMRKKEGKMVDLLSMWRATREKKNKRKNTVQYVTDDGAADREDFIQKELVKLPEEKRNDSSEREKIFREVVKRYGHGRALSVEIGIKATCVPLASSASLTRDYENEIAQMRAEAKKQERCQQEKIKQLATQVEQLRAEAEERERRSEARLVHILQSSGVPVPISTSASNPTV